mgnify:CR=1 FL=1
MENMSKEEVRKILWDAGIEISTKNNLSQFGLCRQRPTRKLLSIFINLF